MLNFKPTYRYNRGNRTWSNEKSREPAWCDRILYKSINKNFITQKEYLPVNELMTSDHSPVYSTFDIEVPVPAIPHQRTKCEIVIRYINGYDLKSSTERPLPNPYIVFQSNFLLSEIVSETKEKTTNPKWESQDIPALCPCISNKETLQLLWIRVVVRDRSEFKNYSLGSGYILLSDACGPNPIFFSTRLIERGRVFGRLEGEIHVTWELPKHNRLTIMHRPRNVSELGFYRKKLNDTNMQDLIINSYPGKWRKPSLSPRKENKINIILNQSRSKTNLKDQEIHSNDEEENFIDNDDIKPKQTFKELTKNDLGDIN